jgi:drug/metabolite transporter (DMT)-like permease
MITAILGLLTAVVYGSADFVAAMATRRIRVLAVTAGSSITGLVALIAMVPIFGVDFSQNAISWGFAAGLFSVTALITLYASLAIGPISIISPLGALISAIVPAIIGVVFMGEEFSATGWLAIFIGLIAVVLIGMVPDSTGARPQLEAILLAIAAGVSIGLAVSSLAQSPADSGIAPVITMRGTAAAILLLLNVPWIIALIRKRETIVKPGDESNGTSNGLIGLIALAGVFDAAANVLFTLASRSGSLTVAGVLTALYPLGTILLARLVLGEKITRLQAIGISLALGASALLALG